MNVNSTTPDFGNVFVATALVILPLAVLAPLAIAWAAALPALWIVIIYLRAGRYPWEGQSWLIPAVLISIVVYSALTVIWSVSPDRTQHIATKLLPIVIGGWLLVGAAVQLDEHARRRTSIALLCGGTVALILVAVEVATGGLLQGLMRGAEFKATGNLIHLNRTASQLAILISLLWLALDRQLGPTAAAAGVGLTAVAVFSLDPDTPQFAAFASIIFLTLAYIVPRIAQGLMIAGVLTVALAIPLYPFILPIVDSTLSSMNIGNFSLRHRFAIWDFAATRTMEKPILGWGLGTSRVVPGADGTTDLLRRGAETLPLHPHNALLQMWLELGIPGILFALVAVVTILSKITRYVSGRKELATALTVIFSATLIAELSYGIWQSWWLVFLWVLAALTIVITGTPARTDAARDANPGQCPPDD